jgi:hypothetical protein
MLMMLDKESSEQSEQPPEQQKKIWRFPLIPAEAVKYLREEHGIIMSVPSLRQRRGRALRRGTPIQDPDRVYDRTSQWTKEELDAIKPSSKTKRVNPGEH